MPATKLLVYVPSLGHNRYNRFLEKFKKLHGSKCRVEVFEHHLGLLDTADLEDTVVQLEASIARWSGDSDGKRANTTEIVLCGHSIGGLLVRAAYVKSLDSGETFSDGKGSWATKVTRFVLIASPNAGFEPSTMPLRWRIAYGVCTFPSTRLTIEQIRAGGYWITDLRFRWVDAMRRADAPLVVQILGSADPVVSRVDVLDSSYMGQTALRQIPNSSHGAIVDISGVQALERWEILNNSIQGPISDFPILEKLEVSTDPVVFVLHGIRASSHERWVDRLRSSLIAAGVSSENVIAANYGFFSAIQFALPWTRHRNVHRFLRDYGDKFVTHDADNFYFVGHSNGTYMMGRALEFVPSMRFHRVLLAGSVLPPTYDWARRFTDAQIVTHGPGASGSVVAIRGEVHNDRAKRDYPVGWLCSWLGGVHQDVGTAGYSGFTSTPTGLREHANAFPPGHGSALTDHVGYPPRMPEVAAFLLDGTAETAPQEQQGPGPFQWVSNAIGLRGVAVTIVLLLVFVVVSTMFLVAGTIGWPLAALYYVAGGFLLWVGLRSI